MSENADKIYPKALAGADWLVRADTQAVLSALRNAGHEARVVGGAVRNALIGKEVGDVDIATAALPPQVIAACRDAGLHTIPTGIDHGTVTVISGHEPHEVTTLRRDVETDGRRATVAFTDDWHLDAERRDLTMNALYCEADGTVHDPVGGYEDLKAGRVRFIGDADQRIAEDYLRILRFFRFHAQHGIGAPDGAGLAACVRGRHGLARLSGERIRAEMMKLLSAPRSVDAVQTMMDFGLLPLVIGRAPRPGIFARIVATEAMIATGPDIILRLSALAIAADEDVTVLAKRWRLSNAERDALTVIDHRLLSLMQGANADWAEARRLLYRWGADAWRRSCVAAAAMASKTDPFSIALLDLPDHWPRPALPVRGADLVAAGIPPGSAIGEILRALETWWVAGDFPDEAETRTKLAELIAARKDG